MSRAILPHDSFHAVDARPHRVREDELEQQVAALQREIVDLQTQRRRDMATARGLGEALQSLRDGTMALRAENEDLRRRLAGHEPRPR
ncbi:hypothetical protein [Patulibacter sp.]|uniref:hypothetical protein n=1 Tax=Patulibacter sp. TaxID=1912859 RepID=UPI0027188F33|nr:hypothetical protein [Patulibacter sp.]MDO9410735.1 hypothetical protein [Patulibacter sp.]